MMKKLAGIILASVVLAGCSSTGVSWDTLAQTNLDSNYCATTLQDPEDIATCEIEYVAAQRANRECQKDTSPEYCILMAGYSWDNFKDIIAKDKPTKETAMRYPILCGIKEKNVKACSKL